LLELIVAAAGSVQRGVSVVELLRAWEQLGKERRLMEDGNRQVLERTSRKGSTVVSHCCELLGTSQKCLNMHFFDEAPKLPHQNRRHFEGQFAGGRSGTFYHSYVDTYI
jgi:hypothetical protein